MASKTLKQLEADVSKISNNQIKARGRAAMERVIQAATRGGTVAAKKVLREEMSEASATNQSELSLKKLESERDRLYKMREQVEKEIVLIDQEIASREMGIKLGEWISIEGVQCLCVDFYLFWPVFRVTTKSGNISKILKNACEWKEYRSGMRKNPW
jgi:hypothetical protein